MNDFKMNFAVNLGGVSYEVEDGYIFELMNGERNAQFELNSNLVRELELIKDLYDHNDARRVELTMNLLYENDHMRVMVVADRDKTIKKVVEGLLDAKEYLKRNIDAGIPSIKAYAEDGMGLSITESEAQEILDKITDVYNSHPEYWDSFVND